MSGLTKNKQLQAYQNNAIQTASKEQLTLMLYNGCIRFTKKAIQQVKEKNYEEKNKNIQKAQDIIRELMLTLDQNMDISKQMLPLYEYIYYQLQQGNIKNDVACLEEALEYITEFRDTWKEAILKVKANKYESGSEARV